MKFRTKATGDKVELLMTPMIDVVFQLLVFFIMTFKITVQEGDFTIKMPLSSSSTNPVESVEIPPIKLRLRANQDGTLAGVAMNGQEITDDDPWPGVHNLIISLVGNESGPIRESAEVELDCDYGLNFEHVIDAITSVSGYRGPQGRIIKLVEKVKFAPQRAP